jgi:WD40 repeat protein
VTAGRPSLSLPPCPYPGIEPFSYAFRDVFFGRGVETEQIAQKLVLHRSVLLYAESGVGKSSLLNAGVFPRAQALLFQPERIRVSPIPGQEFVIERSATGVGGYLPSLFSPNGSADVEVVSAPAFLSRVRARAEAIRGQSDAARPLLVFDQFEEWTTLVQDAAASGRGEEARAAQQSIAGVILSLVQDRSLPVKVMLALREDYLGSLTPLFEEYPDFTDSYVRLEHLDGDAILAAVRGPFTQRGYSPAIPEALAETIRDEFLKKSGGAPIRTTEVQIVCERLYLDVVAGATWERAYEDRKGVQGILEGHLERRLGNLPLGDGDQAVAILGCLLTAEGTRNVVSEPTLVSMVSSESDWPVESLRRTLRGLERDARLIVQSARRGVSFYEIASEFLVPWIRTRSEERRVARQRASAERQERIAAEQRQAKRRTARIVGVLVVGLVAALAAFMVATGDRRRAEAVTVLDAVTQHAMRNTASDPQLGLLLALHAITLGYQTMESPTLASIDAMRQAMAGTPRMRLRLGGHRGGISRLDVSPGGEYIATASADRSVRIWDAETGLTLRVIDAFQGPVRDVAFNPDGRSIATASDDTLRVWDPFNGKMLLALPAPFASSIAYSPDGAMLAAGNDSGRIHVWHLTGGDLRPDSLPQACYSITSIAFSPIGSRLAAGCGGQAGRIAVVWDFADPTSSFAIPGEQVEVAGLAFSPGGDTLALASSCCPRVSLWSAFRPVQFAAIAGHTNAAAGVAFSPSGRLLATVGRDRTVRIVEAATGRQLQAVSGHEFWVEDVAFFADEDRLVTASLDSTAAVWDVAAPGGAQVRALAGHDASVQAVSSGPDGRLLVSLDAGGRALWWDTETGDSLRVGDDVVSWREPNGDTRLAVAGDRIVIMARGDLGFWSLASRRRVDSLVGRSVTAFALAGDSLLALATEEDSILVRNMRTGEMSSFSADLDRVQVMAFSPDAARILTVSGGTIARLFDARSGEVIAERVFPFLVRVVVFRPDGKLIAAAGDGQTVDLLDGDSLRFRRSLPHEDMVMHVAFNQDGQLLASASRDGSARVWNPDSGRILAVFSGHEDGATSVAFLPGDKQLVVGGEDHVVRIHALDLEGLLPVALGLAVRPLSPAECGSLQLLQCPTATDRIVEGRRLALLGRTSEAVDAFGAAKRQGLPLPFEPERAARSLAVSALVATARFHLEANRLDSAGTVFASATALDSTVDTRTMVTEAAWRRAVAGDPAGAGAILRMGAGPRWYRGGSQRDANLLSQLGSGFLDDGRLDDAELAYGLGVAASEGLGDYDRASGYNNFAYILALKKELLDSAGVLVDSAIAIGGADPAYLDTKAWVAYQAGRCAAAVEPIEAALNAEPEDPEIAGHFVTVQCTCGDARKARTILRKWRRPVPKELTRASDASCSS